MINVTGINPNAIPKLNLRSKQTKKRNLEKSNKADVTTKNIALLTKTKFESDVAWSMFNTQYTDKIETLHEIEREAIKELHIREQFENIVIEKAFIEINKESEKALKEINKESEKAFMEINKESGKQVKKNDAKAFAEDYNNKTLLQVCAICGIEDSPATFKDITSIAVKHFSDLNKLFTELTRSLRNGNEIDTSYDINYATQLMKSFDGGLLSNCHSVCGTCCRHISKKKKIKVNIAKTNCKMAEVDVDNNEINEEEEQEEEEQEQEDEEIEVEYEIEEDNDEAFPDNNSPNSGNSNIEKMSLQRKYPLVPKKALVLGLFPGYCPEELSFLNDIELSMISIYHPISKINMQGGKHFHVRGAATYTIVNNLTKVMESLPRMPEKDSFATFRHVRENNHKLYTYRPYYVKRALMWLQQNNFLYENIIFNWVAETNWMSIDPVDIPFVEITDTELTSLQMAEEEEAADNIEHTATNPGTNYEGDVLLMHDNAVLTQLEEIKEIISKVPTFDTSTNFEFVTPYRNPEYFYAKCFPCLYPFGRGCPSDKNLDKSMKVITAHTKHVLSRGFAADGRRFQQNKNYIFTMYTHISKRRIGGIVFCASSKENQDITPVTIGEINQLIGYVNEPSSGNSSVLTEQEIKHLIQRLVPYSKSLPGSVMHIMNERKKLMCMISSPIIKQTSNWRYFLTMAPSDVYDSRLYDIVSDAQLQDILHNADDLDRWAERRNISDTKTKAERLSLLRNHPALSARLFNWKQSSIWAFLINGSKMPFGSVQDFWRRIEFQLRGTPHEHSLLAILHDLIDDSFIDSDVQEESDMVKRLVENVLTAKLVPLVNDNNTDEKAPFDFVAEPEEDISDVRRERFNPELNYEYSDKENNLFVDPTVQNRYARLQRANQTHKCGFTCWKYNKNGIQTCRFGFPYSKEEVNENEATINVSRDKHSKVVVKCHPPRDNAHLNAIMKSPEIILSHGGNSDLQLLNDKHGAAVYAASYSGKAEEPDKVLLNKILMKKMEQIAYLGDVSQSAKMKAVAEAVLASTKIGSVQACYSLLSLPFVISSRKVLNINPLPKCNVYQNITLDQEHLQGADADAAALEHGLDSQMGRRNNYGLFSNQQRLINNDNICYVTFFQLLTNYQFSKLTNKAKKLEQVQLLILDEHGIVSPPNKFIINEIVFKLSKTQIIVNLCPYVPYDEQDERSAYSTLLMHFPWPAEGEINLLRGHRTAVEALRSIRHLFPEYALKTIQEEQRTKDFLSNCKPRNTENHQEQQEETKDAADDEGDEGDIDDEMQTQTDDAETEALITNNEIPITSINGIDHVVDNVSANTYKILTQYISNQQIAFMLKYSRENQIQEANAGPNIRNPNTFSDVNNAPERRAALTEALKTLKIMQLNAFNRIKAYLSGEEGYKQMLMFVSGEGGTGKSKLIELVAENTRLLFGKTQGLFGSVLIMAPTGTAANGIGGFTWQSVLKKSKYNGGTNSTKSTTKTHTQAKVTNSNKKLQLIGKNLRGVKLIIIDEISMISFESLYEISETIKNALLTTCDDEEIIQAITTRPFGGIHILLTGDLFQLKPIMPTAIFDNYSTDKIPCIRGRQIWQTMTDYFELTEACRFLDGNNSALATFLSGARKGIVDDDILTVINERYFMSVDEIMTLAHEKAIWMANTKNDANIINDKCFKNLIKQNKMAYRIVAEHTSGVSLLPPPNESKKEELFRYESDYYGPASIDLAIGSRVSINQNLATQIGVFNGAMGTVRGI